MKKVILITLACLSLSACFQASRETFVAGHNTSSSTVDLSYHILPGEDENINWNKAQDKVKVHCQHVLGYVEAERFGRPKKKCIEDTSEGYCLKHEVTVPYQCLAVGLDTEK